MPKSELCIEQKKAYYNYLHNVQKIEHDNLMKFYHEIVIKGQTSQSH